MYSLLNFAGRFEPFHEGHKVVVDKARSLSKRTQLLLGTNNDGRTLRNPWTYEERVRMIRSVYPDADDLLFAPIFDQPTDELWVQHVNDVVAEVTAGDPNVGLIGCNKDHTSYYLQLFPQWKSEAVEFLNPLNATDIRKMLFEGTHQKYEMVGNILPKAVADFVFQDDMGMGSIDEVNRLREMYAKELENANN